MSRQNGSRTRQVLYGSVATLRLDRPAGFAAFFAVLALLGGLLGASAPRAETGPERVYLWVQRAALEDTLSFRALADSAAAIGCTDLLLQVRGRGEAYYRSLTEPAPAAVEDLSPTDSIPGERPSERSLRFDPLDAALRACRERGLRAHAWINVFLAGRWGEERPAHVLLRHPEWKLRLPDGRLPESLPARERRRLGLEGIYLDPAHPRVIPYLRGVVRELVWRYRLDGLHLDYIRTPHASAGGDSTHAGRVSLAVEAIAAAARDASPAIVVSAAVIPDPDRARRSCAQDWPRWLEEGWCDTVLLMAYTDSIDRLESWSRAIASREPIGGRIVYGFGLHEVEPGSLGRLLDWAAARGEDRLALFSDRQLRSRDELRTILRKRLKGAAG
ncbi:MAG: family 10 glycosylhydrolase [Candidatus Eisenbacteria bacterium]|nr:family 10 glycosylhydrolase [Candidatus Latescibacterota bacterium]MBD3301350.1 family 10 glycosylhydrolase [Candidatus Eisenbacteria bacterium]